MRRCFSLFAGLLLALHAQACVRAAEPEPGDATAGLFALDASLVTRPAPSGAGPPRVPGATPETRAEAMGALRYLELGCVACHSLPHSDRPAFAPDHAAVGLLGEERIRAAIRHPEAANPGTIMPAYADVLDAEGGEDALLAFLIAREGAPPGPAPAGAERGCSSCHAAAADSGAAPESAAAAAEAGAAPETAVAAGAGAALETAAAARGAAHRCVYIRERASELDCARCHDRVPRGRACAFIDGHRAVCAVCHETGGEAR